MDTKKVQNNRFAGAEFDDSDDEPAKVVVNKTQKKKEERKITDKPVVKVNATKMAEGGFEVTDTGRAAPVRGGRGGRGRGDGEFRGRGGRGGEAGEYRGRGGRGEGRGGRGGGDRPRTAVDREDRPPRVVRTDADGNPIHEERKERQPFRGKPREEGHPFDRQSGTGRGRRPVDKKEGHGKFNTGDKETVTYKQKGTVAEDGTVVEAPVEKKAYVPEPEPVVEVEMETIGYSMEEFLANKMFKGKKEARAAEGIKGQKVAANESEKVHQSTVLQNQYLKSTVAKTADANNTYFGFAGDDEGNDVPSRGGRGGRGGDRGRGGRGGRGGNADGGARRQNPKQALKKTEDDFPTL